MDSGLSPKEQVELMLKRARTIEQIKILLEQQKK